MSEITVRPAAGRSLLFVCPAQRRVELAAICYQQFAHAREVCAGFGLRAEFLILSDDDNLDAALEAGLCALEVPNRLGERLNTGFVFAAEAGYDYVCAVGNDSWLWPDRFSLLPDDESLLCTRNYTSVLPDGSGQDWLRLDYPGGVGSRVIPLKWLEPSRYRPLDPFQMSGCDTGILTTICRGVPQAPHLVYTDFHPYETVGFQTGGDQITPWGLYVAQYGVETQPAFQGLADYYPADLVAAVRAHYAQEVSA